MTQFKVGDRVRRKDGLKVWDGGPDTAIVKGIHRGCYISVIAHPNNGASEFDETRDWVMSSDSFHLVSTTPPATIQHEGYNYTRGEPVIPEWVKDGAWVVEKETGDVMRLAVSKHAAKAININGHIKWYGSAPKNVPSVFRPFTDADWKWGMWAEYHGEKVVVMSSKDGGGVFASRPTNTYFFALFSEITPTTAP